MLIGALDAAFGLDIGERALAYAVSVTASKAPPSTTVAILLRLI
jgi:hypothetical protein